MTDPATEITARPDAAHSRHRSRVKAGGSALAGLTFVGVIVAAILSTTSHPGRTRPSSLQPATASSPTINNSTVADATVGPLSVYGVPTSVVRNTGLCNYSSPTEACWGGKIADSASASKASASYGTTDLMVVVSVGSPGPGLAGAPGNSVQAIDGTTVDFLQAGALEMATFPLNGELVSIRTTNFPVSVATNIATQMLEKQ